VAPTAGRMLDTLKGGNWDLILLDVRLPDMDGLDAIPKCRDLGPDTPIIVMTAHGTREVATEAISRGAYDFFTKPLKMTEFQVVVARALERRRLQVQIKALQAAQGSGFEELVGKSESLKRVVEMAQRAAPAEVTVLIEGERGTFTGAVRAKPGRFELAREGTIFLDEIGDMPLSMQVKILRALQEREIERVGGTKPIAIDVRVVAATHQNLEQLVTEGKFRADLFY